MGRLHRVIVGLLVVVVSVLMGCEKSPDSWPEKIRESLYISQKNEEIALYHKRGTYEVHYKTAACWPADEYISATVAHMSSKGWQRLREDFLNPGFMHAWTREKYKQWSFHEDRSGNYVHQWIDDWEDKDNNIVRYFLTYTIKKVGTVGISSMDCNLEADVMFIPREVRPTPSDVAAMKKRADAEVDRLKRQQK